MEIIVEPASTANASTANASDDSNARDLDLDVNDDGNVSALDALLIVNVLSSTTKVGESEAWGSTNASFDSESGRLDVNRDEAISALDALLVINSLGARQAEAESVPSLGRGFGPTLGLSGTVDNHQIDRFDNGSNHSDFDRVDREFEDRDLVCNTRKRDPLVDLEAYSNEENLSLDFLLDQNLMSSEAVDEAISCFDLEDDMLD